MKNFKKALKIEQENQKNLMKNTHGITLIALVITVIVMLILAGVAISVLTQNNKDRKWIYAVTSMVASGTDATNRKGRPTGYVYNAPTK